MSNSAKEDPLPRPDSEPDIDFEAVIRAAKPMQPQGEATSDQASSDDKSDSRDQKNPQASSKGNSSAISAGRSKARLNRLTLLLCLQAVFLLLQVLEYCLYDRWVSAYRLRGENHWVVTQYQWLAIYAAIVIHPFCFVVGMISLTGKKQRAGRELIRIAALWVLALVGLYLAVLCFAKVQGLLSGSLPQLSE